MSSRGSRSTKRKADEEAPAGAGAAADVATTKAAVTKSDSSKKQKKGTEPSGANKRKAKGSTAAADGIQTNQPRKKPSSKPAKKKAAAADAASAIEKPKSKKAKTAETATGKQSSRKQADKSKSKIPQAAGAVARKGADKQQTTNKKDNKPKKTATAAAAEDQPKKSKRKSKKQQQEQEAQEEDEKSPHDVFMEMIAEKEKQLNKHCIILEQFDGDEDEVTIEELQKLKKVFVPEKTWEEFVEVWSELDSVGEDTEDEGEGEEEEGDGAGLAAFMKAFMGKFLNTKHGAEMHTILNKYLKAVDKALKAKAWQDAFCRWAAIVMAARREGHWWEETDTPDDAVAIYNKLREQWSKLKARSNEELGGLVCEGELSAKEELGAYLQGMADEMKQMDYDLPTVA